MKAEYVYLLESNMGYYKIGITKDLNKRIKQFGVQLPFKVSILWFVDVDDARRYEKWLHNFFKNKRVNGEWFIFDYWTLKAIVEYINSEEDLDEFIEFCEALPGQYDPAIQFVSYKIDMEMAAVTESNNLTIEGLQQKIDQASNALWATTA